MRKWGYRMAHRKPPMPKVIPPRVRAHRPKTNKPRRLMPTHHLEPHQAVGGRKPLLTDPWFARRAYDCARKGMTISATADALGVAHQTMRLWLSSAEKAEAKPHEVEFRDAFRRGEVEYREELLDLMQQRHVVRDWRAATWMLERRFKGEYDEAPKQLHVEGEIRHTVVPVEQLNLPLETLRQIRQAMAELQERNRLQRLPGPGAAAAEEAEPEAEAEEVEAEQVEDAS